MRVQVRTAADKQRTSILSLRFGWSVSHFAPFKKAAFGTVFFSRDPLKVQNDSMKALRLDPPGGV
jgi:hypothetical protein